MRLKPITFPSVERRNLNFTETFRAAKVSSDSDLGVKLDAVAHGDHDFLARVFDLVKWERLIADLARVLATLRGAGAVVTFHNDAVEADYFSVCGAKELELHGNI